MIEKAANFKRREKNYKKIGSMKTKYEEMKGGSRLLHNSVHLPAFGQI